ncbi:hypothetical protein [Actinophytocola sp.]|uniref:hypothetical protein n=1 Tax=Actinophytocola sp. TaxID=1872138 RepID=UPI00389A3C0D
MIIYILARLAVCILGYTLGYTLAKALGSWTEALVVITCLYILFGDDSRKS